MGPDYACAYIPNVSEDAEHRDVAHLRNLVNDFDKGIYGTQAGATFIHMEGVDRQCVYTDGSCMMPKHDYLAHAGWSVVYGNTKDAVSDCEPYRAAVQTSYRGELRALAQALARVKTRRPEIPSKSGLMLGLGETVQEVLEVCADLRSVGCEMITIGQYLQPSA